MDHHLSQAWSARAGGLTEKDISDLADARLVLEATSIARAPRAARDTLADRLDAGGIAAQQGGALPPPTSIASSN